VIIRRIPMDALQKGVYKILTTHSLDVPVYDDVPHNTKMPYITLGAFTCKNTGNKTTDISDVSLQVHIWSEYAGKTEVNQIANDVTALLTSWPLDLSASGFNVMSRDVNFFEAFPDDGGGYHGVLTLVCKIQNKGVTT